MNYVNNHPEKNKIETILDLLIEMNIYLLVLVDLTINPEQVNEQYKYLYTVTRERGMKYSIANCPLKKMKKLFLKTKHLDIAIENSYIFFRK